MIAREQERKVLLEAQASPEAELVSVIGRWRVGKTYLVDETYGSDIDYSLTGAQYANKNIQLSNFVVQLEQLTGKNWTGPLPRNWVFAFNELAKALEKRKKEKGSKVIVFFDELPWLASKRSGFMEGFNWFWNSWASKQKILVVICGSAASWMIRKIVQNKGGLHNRITRRINVKPFNLAETEEFLKSRSVTLGRRQILDIYMTMGGVPHYLNQVVKGWSSVQSIEKICFSPNGFLRDEFDQLYPALFENSEKHITVVRELAKHHYGLDRSKLQAAMGLKDGGGVSKVLTELEQSGFIQSVPALDKKKKKKIFRLIDEYSLFYLRFIEPNKNSGSSNWAAISQTQAFKSWCGYAFENIGLKHVAQIKNSLGILGIRTRNSAFHHSGNKDYRGVKIDLIIDRPDQVVNLCEFKFYDNEIVLTKDDEALFATRKASFLHFSGTKKYPYWTLISLRGLKENQYSLGTVDQSLTADVFFGEAKLAFR
jgi:AAA+ ATPase superfamily predicted ATPase